ncbi:MAG: CHAT domain-containing protein, partial [Alphaproteobacteria bacterium]|nr:CHAT domain-containing protein [Alphaproteobacteria bacterium]
LKIALSLNTGGSSYVASKIREEVYRDDIFSSNIGYIFLHAKSKIEVGDIARSKQMYDEILSHQQSVNFSSILWVSLFDRGRIAEIENNRIEAISFFKRAIDVIEQMRSSVNTEASKVGFVGDKQQPYQQLVKLLVAEDRTAEAFEYVERAHSRALVDLLASRSNLATPTTDVKATSTMITALNQAEMDALVLDKKPEGITTQRSVVAEIRDRIKREAPELASLVTVSAPKASDLQALVPLDETLIAYHLAGEDLYAFLVTRRAIEAVKLDGKDLAAAVGRFRAAVQNPNSTDSMTHARALYNRLVAPLRSRISTERLVIVPHGVLHYLPFAALHSDNSYLIDDFSLRFLPSASVAQFLKARRGGQETALVLGNPDLGDPKFALEHAEAEAQAVAATRPGSTVLVRKEASATNFRQQAGNYRVVHFAGHAKFDATAPLESGLYMAAAHSQAGLVTVGDLYGMRLDADLVTLSACSTGIGKAANGDEIIGLTRGFLYAGARSVVTSLWDVDDEATSNLMGRFYDLNRRMDYAEALREAQRAVKNRYPHPVYWAAFQVTGNGR